VAGIFTACVRRMMIQTSVEFGRTGSGLSEHSLPRRRQMVGYCRGCLQNLLRDAGFTVRPGRLTRGGIDELCRLAPVMPGVT